MCARLLLLVATVVTVAAVAEDPYYSLSWPGPAHGCTGSAAPGGRRTAECALDAGRVTLSADAAATSLKITCDDEGSFSCAELSAAAPLLTPSPPRVNFTLGKLEVRNCLLPPEPLRCAAMLLGATDAELLLLADVRGQLRPQHVEGMRAVEKLRLYYAEGENHTSVPFDTLALLPAVRSFTLRRGTVALTAQTAPTALLPALRALELADGGLRSVPAGAFSNAPGLDSLALWSNSIDSIDDGALAGLSALVNLSLNSNQLATLPAGLFRPTPRLSRLDLYNNPLQALPAELFRGLHSLTQVLIFENSASLHLPPKLFADLPALDHLVLKTASIQSLPPDLFQNTTNIHQLDLSGNQLESLPEGIFHEFQKLKILDLSNNKLESLSLGLLSRLKVLENLDLRGNKLKVLEGGVFGGLKGVQVLHLGGNLLETLERSLFTGLSALRELYLPGNRIQTLHSETFIPVNKLEVLSLAGNNMSITRQVNTRRFMSALQHAQYQLDHESVPSDETEYHSPLRELTLLQRLDLSHNRVELLCDDWRNSWSLRSLRLAHNLITELTGLDMAFTSDAITVDLTHNRIHHFEPYPATGASTPTFLLDHNPYVCDCQLYPFVDMRSRNILPPNIQIENAICSDPPLLKHTRLTDLKPDDLICEASNCPTECSCTHRPSQNRTDVSCVELPDDLPFNPNTRLRLRQASDLSKLPSHINYLDLSAMNLTDVPKISRSIEIDLTNNHLNAIPLDLLKLNCVIHFSNNPIDCTCDNKQELEFLKLKNHLVRDYNNLTCDNNLLLSGLDTDSLCAARDSTIIGCTIALIGVFIAVATGIAYRYMTLIRIVLRKLGLWCGDETDDKLYDAFISFSHQDELYVVNTLVPRLESGVRPLKLCLHYRDWVIGDFIPSQISRSVEDSRRTIIVLSEHFLKSVWAQMEFRAAHGRERLLILMLDDLSSYKDLDPDLRAYISVNTYVKADDPLVFDRLKDAVLTKRRDFVKPPKSVDKPAGLDVTLNINNQLVNNARTPS